MSSEGFHEPDWSLPLDLDERVQRAPEGIVIKGMFFEQVQTVLNEHASEVDASGHFGAFRDYPLRDWLQLLHDGAVKIFPGFPPQRAIFEMGRPTFGRFRSSLLGRVLFANDTFEACLRSATKAYKRTSTVTTCEVVDVLVDRATVQIRGCWDFPAWHVGVFHGALQTCGKHPSIQICQYALQDFDLEITWDGDEAGG